MNENDLHLLAAIGPSGGQRRSQQDSEQSVETEGDEQAEFVPTLQMVSNPLEQFKLDVEAIKQLLRQGKTPTEAVSLLNFYEVAANERPQNTHPENYVEIIKTTAAREFRLESRRQPYKGQSPNQEQQNRSRRGRTLS